MRKSRMLLWLTAILALPGIASVVFAEGEKTNRTAIVRSIHGQVEYSQGDKWQPLIINRALPPGTTVKTGPDSFTDLTVNGVLSAIRITSETTVQLQTMDAEGLERDSPTTTLLDLKQGTILGNVKKLSPQSRYEIHTPDGTAASRGGDYQVSVLSSTNGGYTVTFTCIQDELDVSAVVAGAPVVHVLRAGEEWSPASKK